MDWSKLGSGCSDRVVSGELQNDANGGKHLLHTLAQIGNFVRAFRTKLRFGELSQSGLEKLHHSDIVTEALRRFAQAYDTAAREQILLNFRCLIGWLPNMEVHNRVF